MAKKKPRPKKRKKPPAGKRTKRARGRPPATAPDWATGFLSALRTQGTVHHACLAAGVARSTVYARRHSDGAFDADFAAALEDGTDELEREAIRRGAEGYDEPVIYQGVLMGRWVNADGTEAEEAGPPAKFVPLCVRKYSDQLLANLLKWRRYGEKVNLEHSGRIDSTVEHDIHDDLLPYAAVVASLVADAGRPGAVPPDDPA